MMYRPNPLATLQVKTANMMGVIMFIILCCSLLMPLEGIMRCISTIPMMVAMGMMCHGSGALRSVRYSHPAWRSSMALRSMV